MDTRTRSHPAAALRREALARLDRWGCGRSRGGGLRPVGRCESIGQHGGQRLPRRERDGGRQRAPRPPPSGEAIKVAQIAAHSGQLAQLGAWDKEALDLAFKEKMDAGGVCGRPLELSVFDNQGDPTVGVNVTRQALETGIVAAFATTESAVTLAVIPLFQDAKVPHFTAGQSDAITKEGSAYVFRDGPPAAAFNKTLADYALNTKKWTKIAMVTNTGGYGDSERKAFTAQLTAASIQPLLDATVAPEAQEFTAQINEIKRLAAGGRLHGHGRGPERPLRQAVAGIRHHRADDRRASGRNAAVRRGCRSSGRRLDLLESVHHQRCQRQDPCFRCCVQGHARQGP